MTLDTQPRAKRRDQMTKNSAGPRPDPPPTTPTPPRMPARRNPRWIALGLVAICLGGLLAYGIYSRVTTEATVLGVTHTVYRGQTLAAGDLTPITVSGTSELNTVPSDQLDQLVGKQAVYDLVEGSLVPAEAVSEVPTPGRGRAVVGLKLAQGRAPANLLNPGSPVRLVALPPAGNSPAAEDVDAGKTYAARVVDASPGADGTSTLVNVDLPADRAPTVALLAAQERVALLRDADR